MGSSLKDQLLKTGLVDSNRAKEAKKQKAGGSIQQRRKAAPAMDENRARAQQAREKAAERDRQLNLRRKEDADRKADAAQFRQLVETNRVARENGDVAYNFQHNNKIRKILVTEATRKQIVAGSLAIVKLGSGYEVVPAGILEKIPASRTGSVVLLNDPLQPDNRDSEADHPVPDDLMW
jgi:hypothetical protein